MLNEALFSSDSGEWETPDDLFSHYATIFRFDVDLAAQEHNTKLHTFISPELDSLKQNWLLWGRVGWLNPPYGRGIIDWVKKCCEEQERGFTTVALLPARTDTKWFHRYVKLQANVTFLEGRLKFVGAPSSAPFPSMVAVYEGHRRDEECRSTTTKSTRSQRRGCETSSPLDTSPPETLTSETSDSSSPTTSEATTSAISSPVSASGVTPCDKQDGPTTAQCGLEVVLASPSVSLESEPEPQMSGTSGPNSSVSSASAILQSSLVNRFRARTASLGSSLFKLTWKERATPSGRSIPALRGSAHRTSGNACTSLPTPSGTSNHGKNHVAGRLDEWGGSSNPFRGTDLGRLHLPSFECWMMGLPAAWQQLTPTATLSSRRSRPK